MNREDLKLGMKVEWVSSSNGVTTKKVGEVVYVGEPSAIGPGYGSENWIDRDTRDHWESNVARRRHQGIRFGVIVRVMPSSKSGRKAPVLPLYYAPRVSLLQEVKE